MDKEQPHLHKTLTDDSHRLFDAIQSDSLAKDKDTDLATLIRKLKALIQHTPRVPLMEYSTFDSV